MTPMFYCLLILFLWSVVYSGTTGSSPLDLDWWLAVGLPSVIVGAVAGAFGVTLLG